MYQLVSASTKLKNSSASWTSRDITATPLKDLFSIYSGVFAILSNPFVTEQVAFDLNKIRNDYANSNITFTQFLINNGNLALDTQPKEDAIFVKQYAIYNDAFKAGYTVDHVAPNSPPGTVHAYQDKTWLHLTKQDVNYQTFFERCMVNVNGYYHRVDYDQYGAYVIDGMKSKFLSGMNLIGILSFGKIGKIEYVPITTDMIYKQTPDQKFKDNCFIDIGMDVSNKTVILVIGGYMHLIDPVTFRMIATDRCVINFSNYPLMERYYESNKYIDLTSLPIDHTSTNPDHIGITNFYSDEVITALLTLPQSFFVILDAVDVSIEKKFLRTPLLPEMYVSDIKPEYPMITGYGKVSNYWSVKEHSQWSVTVVDAGKDNFVFKTSKTGIQQGITSNRVPGDPVRRSLAYFLAISKEV